MPMVLPRSKPRGMQVNISPVLLDHGKDDRRHQWFAGRLDRLDAHVRLRVIGRHHHFQNAARRHGDYALRYDDVLGPAAGILTELHIRNWRHRSRSHAATGRNSQGVPRLRARPGARRLSDTARLH